MAALGVQPDTIACHNLTSEEMACDTAEEMWACMTQNAMADAHEAS